MNPSPKRAIARAILAVAVQNNEAYVKALREIMHHWTTFVPFAPRHMLADEGEVAYLDDLYSTLRAYAFEWYALDQIEELKERLNVQDQP